MRARLTIATLLLSLPFALTQCVGDDPQKAASAGDSGSADAPASEASSPDAAGGDGASDAADGAVVCAKPSADFLDDAIDVSASEDFACAVRRGGTVFCWGNNNTFHQLAQDPATVPKSSTPLPVNGIATGATIEVAVQVTTGQGHGCARTASGKAFCWGSNIYGESGANQPTGGGQFLTSPKAVVDTGGATLTGITEIRDGEDHACAIANKQLYCFGRNDNSRLGFDKATATVAASATLIPLGAGVEAIAVAPAGLTTCAILKKPSGVSDVACWGQNAYGMWGNDTASPFVDTPVPQTVLQLSQSNVSLTTSTDGHACAKGTAFPVACWGANIAGEIGGTPAPDGGTVTIGHAIQVPQLPATVKAISAAAWETCALRDDGKIACMGSNQTGQLGQGGTDPNPHPAPGLVKDPSGVTELGDAFAISVGGRGSGGFACAIVGKTPSCGGQIYCWGRNPFGELGNGVDDGAVHSLPVKVIAPK